MSNLYTIALEAILRIKNETSIIVIGANDGKLNDPAYDLCMKFSDRSNVCLIEPNFAVLPYLRENYASHNRHVIVNCAIGPEDELKLYVIKEEFWKDYQPNYARDWPKYRAPTGLSSFNREHLAKALLKRTILNPNEAIASISVPCKPLVAVLKSVSLELPIDVLQIDAEGYDDYVIYSSNLESTKPRVIYFESRHLQKERQDDLLLHLSKLKYKVYKLGSNSMAVSTRFDLLSIYVNGLLMLREVASTLSKFIGTRVQ